MDAETSMEIDGALREAVDLLTMSVERTDDSKFYLSGIARIEAAMGKIAAYLEMERLRVAMLHEASVRSSCARE